MQVDDKSKPCYFSFKHLMVNNRQLQIRLESSDVGSFEKVQAVLSRNLNSQFNIADKFIIIGTKDGSGVVICNEQHWNEMVQKGSKFGLMFINNRQAADNNGNAHGKSGKNNDNSNNANNNNANNVNDKANANEFETDEKHDISKSDKNKDKMSWDFNIENVCYDEQVHSLISNLFPNIGKMWQHNPTELLKSLREKQMIAYSKVEKNISVYAKGYDKAQVIKNYDQQLRQELSKILPTAQGEMFNKLVTTAQAAICKVHDQALSTSWPHVNSGPSKGIVEIDESHCVDEKVNNIEYVVTWYMSGFLRVCDETQSAKGKRTYFKTECTSNNMAFKYVVLKKYDMNSLNKNLSNQKEFNQMKQYLDKVEMEQLSWDDI